MAGILLLKKFGAMLRRVFPISVLARDHTVGPTLRDVWGDNLSGCRARAAKFCLGVMQLFRFGCA